MQLTTHLSEKADKATNSTQPVHQTADNPDRSKEASISRAATSDSLRHNRTTDDLLSWADDIAGIEEGLPGQAALPGHLNDLGVLDAFAKPASESGADEITSSEIAAKALLKAAQHKQEKSRGKSATSRYMQGKSHLYKRFCKQPGHLHPIYWVVLSWHVQA